MLSLVESRGGRCSVPWKLMEVLPSGTCDSRELPWLRQQECGGLKDFYTIVLNVGILIPSTFQTPEFSHMASTRYEGWGITVSGRAATPGHNSALWEGHWFLVQHKKSLPSYMNCSTFHYNFMKQMLLLLFPFFWLGNWVTESLKNLPEVTQLVSVWVRFEPR